MFNKKTYFYSVNNNNENTVHENKSLIIND